MEAVRGGTAAGLTGGGGMADGGRYSGVSRTIPRDNFAMVKTPPEIRMTAPRSVRPNNCSAWCWLVPEPADAMAPKQRARRRMMREPPMTKMEMRTMPRVRSVLEV